MWFTLMVLMTIVSGIIMLVGIASYHLAKGILAKRFSYFLTMLAMLSMAVLQGVAYYLVGTWMNLLVIVIIGVLACYWLFEYRNVPKPTRVRI